MPSSSSPRETNPLPRRFYWISTCFPNGWSCRPPPRVEYIYVRDHRIDNRLIFADQEIDQLVDSIPVLLGHLRDIQGNLGTGLCGCGRMLRDFADRSGNERFEMSL